MVGIAQVLVILTPLMQHPLLNGPQGISVTLTGIVKMTCNSQSGDSGCIVYTPDDMNIAGTLIGGVTNSNPSYFMPASRTVEKYGLELY